MDDYIFLIIAVVISIFAAIKKNKKKVADVPLEKKVEKPRNFIMDQLLGDDFLADSDDEVDFPEWPEPEIRKQPLVAIMPEESKLPEPQIFQSHLPKRQSSNIQLSVKKTVPEEVDEIETEDIPGYLEDFSLRKAFVYSEIMTPKFRAESTSLF